MQLPAHTFKRLLRFVPTRFHCRLVEHFRLHFPNSFSPVKTTEHFFMLASPRDWVTYKIYFFGTYDVTLTTFFKMTLRPEMTCLDIGANYGWFTLLMAKLVGPKGNVISVEADPDIFLTLQSNVSLNSFNNITLKNAAAGRLTGHASFVRASDSILAGTLHPRVNSGIGYLTRSATSDSIALPAVTIDDLVKSTALRSLDMIKIDVEGAEADVLDGAKHTLAAYKPILVVEYNSFTLKRYDSSVYELDSLLARYNYRRYLFDNGFIDISSRLHTLDDPHALANVFCFPQS